jgi:hypothetical protein
MGKLMAFVRVLLPLSARAQKYFDVGSFISERLSVLWSAHRIERQKKRDENEKRFDSLKLMSKFTSSYSKELSCRFGQ